MDLVTGALGKLPSMLLELLNEQYKLQTSVRAEVEFLSRELESTHAALRKVAEVPLDQLFSLSKVKARHDIAGAIEEIKKQLQEMAERRARYRVDDVLAKPAAATSIDPRLSALFTKRSQLVGMNMPMSTLINMLSVSDDDMSNKKIVCVVGFGGLGKTTLAKRVFDEFKANFCCAAFVSVGRIPDLKKVFRDILINLGHTDSNLMILDETQLINLVRGFLESKRFRHASLSLFLR